MEPLIKQVSLEWKKKNLMKSNLKAPGEDAMLHDTTVFRIRNAGMLTILIPGLQASAKMEWLSNLWFKNVYNL